MTDLTDRDGLPVCWDRSDETLLADQLRALIFAACWEGR